MREKWKIMIASGGAWIFVILFFWNTLYGRVVNKVTTAEDLFQFTSSRVGIQAQFLHAVPFLMIYLLMLSFFLLGDQIYVMYRRTRNQYSKKIIIKQWKVAIYFVSIYEVVYTICLLRISSFSLLKANGFFLSLIFYGIVLISFYSLFGMIFLVLSSFLDGKMKALIISIAISLGCFVLFYFGKIPTPFQGMDVFDMVYYQHSILIFTYARRLVFNIFIIFIVEYIFQYIIQKKDVMANEIL